MKITAGRIDAFLKDIPSAIRVVFLFGPDSGLVRERSKEIARRILEDPDDPFCLAEFSGATLSDDPARLADEAAALSLTGGRRLVLIRDVNDRCAEIFSHFLAEAPGEALIVVEAGNLGARSKLRSAFEKSKIAAALPCYTDDGQALNKVIRQTFSEAGLKPTADAVSFLCANLGGDRMISRSELQKLCLYAAGTGQITLDDAVACVGDSAIMTLDDISFAVGAGNVQNLGGFLDRARQEAVQPISILRALQRHFQRLHLAAGLIAEGASRELALKALRPPVFFKQASAFGLQLGFWTRDALDDALAALASAEIDCKSTGMPAETVCHQALLRLATGASRRKARLQRR
jgi:DNA polymerase-3 subunit delta